MLHVMDLIIKVLHFFGVMPVEVIQVLIAPAASGEKRKDAVQRPESTTSI
jgi:hypothetical protein